MARSSIIVPQRDFRIVENAIPAHVAPMLARPGGLPAHPKAYNFEWKWDGIRAVCFHENGKLRLQSRNQIDITARYPELQEMSRALDGHSAVLDGEIVALDDAGLPSFAKLQLRMHVGNSKSVSRLMRQVPVLYVVFDLLYLDGRSLMKRAYRERRQQLEGLQLAGANWQITSIHSGDGEAMLSAARKSGLEGIVAKRSDSIYEPGTRSMSWIKIKVVQRQEFVVGGWIPQSGGRGARIGAMLLGYYDLAGRLRYAGRIGTGLNDQDHPMLTRLFARRSRKTNPFNENVPGGHVHYVSPITVVEVEYRRWPDGGLVQQGAFKGLRFDKNARQVMKERNAEP